jgi:flavin-dependent dehydrogenase
LRTFPEREKGDVLDRKLNADIAIVGAGLAGLVAAIEARVEGVDILVVDKLPNPESWNALPLLPGVVGNDTWRSGGGGFARFDGTR